LARLQTQLVSVKLLIIDELDQVPLSPTAGEILFKVFSYCYESGSTIVTSHLPFDEWTSVLGSERLKGALLDRLTRHTDRHTANLFQALFRRCYKKKYSMVFSASARP
jgi:DNA replication protein DnaC